MEDSFMKYNQRIDSILTNMEVFKRSRETWGPAGRFKKDNAGLWEPEDHPGYTIITPTFEDDSDNVETYTTLGAIRDILLERIVFSKCVPSPVASIHLTIADLIAGKAYKNGIMNTKEQELLQVLSSVFSQLILPGLIRMEVRGVSLFTQGFVIALVGAVDENGYMRLTSLRDVIYRDERLKNLGVVRKFKLTGHLTLAYIEETLSEQDQNQLAETLITLNKQFFATPLPLNIARAEVRKFDNMTRFYRQREWPVFEFVQRRDS